MFESEYAHPHARIVKLQRFDKRGKLFCETQISLDVVKPENREGEAQNIARMIREMIDEVR